MNYTVPWLTRLSGRQGHWASALGQALECLPGVSSPRQLPVAVQSCPQGCPWMRIKPSSAKSHIIRLILSIVNPGLGVT
jgi:hypothetical protein